MLWPMRYATSPQRMDSWLSRRERDGLTWAELSRSSGIPVWRLRYRARQEPARRTGRGLAVGRRLLPVTVVSSERTRALEIVVPSGLRVLVPPDFDPGHLGRVLQALNLPC